MRRDPVLVALDVGLKPRLDLALTDLARGETFSDGRQLFAVDPPLAAAAAELSPAAPAAAADPPLAAADAEEDAKACSKDKLTPANAVIISTAKITGILVFI